jgi:hypothetical protein
LIAREMFFGGAVTDRGLFGLRCAKVALASR